MIPTFNNRISESLSQIKMGYRRSISKKINIIWGSFAFRCNTKRIWRN